MKRTWFKKFIVQVVNRSSSSKNRKTSLFTITSKLRISSKYFIDKEPTYEHSYPTEERRYNPSHHLSTLVDSSSSQQQNYNTPSSTRTNLPSRKNTLLNDMTDPFQSPCSSAYLVNNQNTPCTISSFSTYSSVNSENNNLPADLTTEAVEIE